MYCAIGIAVGLCLILSVDFTMRAVARRK